MTKSFWYNIVVFQLKPKKGIFLHWFIYQVLLFLLHPIFLKQVTPRVWAVTTYFHLIHGNKIFNELSQKFGPGDIHSYQIVFDGTKNGKTIGSGNAFQTINSVINGLVVLLITPNLNSFLEISALYGTPITFLLYMDVIHCYDDGIGLGSKILTSADAKKLSFIIMNIYKALLIQHPKKSTTLSNYQTLPLWQYVGSV